MKQLAICRLALVCVLAWTAPALAGVDEGVQAYQQGNFEAAYQAFAPAAGAGDPAAQYGLGVMYYGGRGVDQDYVQSWKWFKLAADQGHAQAQARLASVESQLTPAELAEAQDLAAAFQSAAEIPVTEPATEPVTEPAMESSAEVAEAMPEESAAEPVLPGLPALHGRVEPPESTQGTDEALGEVTVPVQESPLLHGIPALRDQAGPEPEAEETPAAEKPQPPALPLPGFHAPMAQAPAAEPAPAVEEAPAQESAVQDEATAQAEPPLKVEETQWYAFYHPEDFEPVTHQGADTSFGKDGGRLDLSLSPSDIKAMSQEWCEGIAGRMTSDLVDLAVKLSGQGGGFLGGGAPEPRVETVVEATVTESSDGVQHCNFAFAHDVGGEWTVVDRTISMRPGDVMFYTTTMTYLRDSDLEAAMRPAYEAFEVK